MSGKHRYVERECVVCHTSKAVRFMSPADAKYRKDYFCDPCARKNRRKSVSSLELGRWYLQKHKPPTLYDMDAVPF